MSLEGESKLFEVSLEGESKSESKSESRSESKCECKSESKSESNLFVVSLKVSLGIFVVSLSNKR